MARLSRARRLTQVVCAAAAGMTALAVIGSPAANAATPKVVPDSAPKWVAKTRAVSRAKSTAAVSFKVYLAPNGGLAGLKSDVAAVSDPKSKSYRKFLSASKYHARYDATDAALAKVTSWLSSKHLTVTAVDPNHRYVSVSSTVGRTESAFGSRINRYRHGGKLVQANASALKVPSTLAPLITTVVGLDTTPRVMTHDAAPPPPAFVNARPCSTYYGQLAATKQADFKTPLPKFKNKVLPYAVCGYTGPQYRAAYEDNLSAGVAGAGVTVAITDAYAAPTIAKDADKYAKAHGDGAYRAGQLTQSLPGGFTNEDLCGPSGWYGEETLDVEAVHAMAPDANIKYYASVSCLNTDFLDTLARVVNDDTADIVTNSWASSEEAESTDEVAAYEGVFLQGAMQGISFMFSTGDNGDEVATTGLKQTNYPASDPYVTAVGGTADAIGPDGKHIFQTGWGTYRYSLGTKPARWLGGAYLYGAGGGSSTLFNKPDYQQGIVPQAYGSGRAVPDVGLDADPTTGMLIGETQTFPDGSQHYGEYRIGGTSLASPLFAGMTSLTLQHAGSRLGLLNPLIYDQYGTSTFTDILGAPADAGNVRVDYVNSVNSADGLRYTVRTFNQDSSLRVRTGWDPVTGIGSPNSGWITSVSPN